MHLPIVLAPGRDSFARPADSRRSHPRGAARARLQVLTKPDGARSQSVGGVGLEGENDTYLYAPKGS